MFGGIPVEVCVHCRLFEGIPGECSSWCEVGLCAMVGAPTSAMLAFPCAQRSTFCRPIFAPASLPSNVSSTGMCSPQGSATPTDLKPAGMCSSEGRFRLKGIFNRHTVCGRSVLLEEMSSSHRHRRDWMWSHFDMWLRSRNEAGWSLVGRSVASTNFFTSLHMGVGRFPCKYVRARIAATLPSLCSATSNSLWTHADNTLSRFLGLCCMFALGAGRILSSLQRDGLCTTVVVLGRSKASQCMLAPAELNYQRCQISTLPCNFFSRADSFPLPPPESVPTRLYN